MPISQDHPTVTFLVGLPGIGKSCFFNDNDWNEHYSSYVSSDHIIDEVADMIGVDYSDIFIDVIKHADALAHVIFDSAIKKSFDITVDRTNMNAISRSKFMFKVPSSYRKVAVVFPFPGKHHYDEELHNARLNSRNGKEIPDGVMRNMINNYAEPGVHEGFDEIRYVNMRGELEGREIREKSV